MQDTEFKEFDQLLRSRLADAEVKPSRRVWKGVSARLAADAEPVALIMPDFFLQDCELRQ